jgi:hypothetical protein
VVGALTRDNGPFRRRRPSALSRWKVARSVMRQITGRARGAAVTASATEGIVGGSASGREALAALEATGAHDGPAGAV